MSPPRPAYPADTSAPVLVYLELRGKSGLAEVDSLLSPADYEARQYAKALSEEMERAYQALSPEQQAEAQKLIAEQTAWYEAELARVRREGW